MEKSPSRHPSGNKRVSQVLREIKKEEGLAGIKKKRRSWVEVNKDLDE